MGSKVVGLWPLACLLIMLTPYSVTATESTLDQAYALLEQGDFQAAGNLARGYLATNPRRYRAEFIVAVTDCRLRRGSDDALREIAALKEDYVLSAEAETEVNGWIAFCSPTPQVSQSGVTVSARTNLPKVASAAPSKVDPAALPRMSALVDRTSYSGDVYDERKGIASAADCSRLCRVQAPCGSMTYAKSTKTCWLKRRVPPAKQSNDFISAIKLN